MNKFCKILNIITEIANESSRNEKENIIKNINSDLCDLFKTVVYFAYNPYLKFNVNNIEFISSNTYPENIDELFNYLIYLSKKRGCTIEENKKLSELASSSIECFEIVHRIINKDLRCGVSTKTWKKYISTLPEHNVMLCDDDLDKFMKLARKNDAFNNICWSIKLDGVRCTAIVDSDSVLYLSRNGLEFPNFDVFDSDLINVAKNIVDKYNISYPIEFDGEVIAKDGNFTNIMSQVRRLKELDKSIFKYCIFDLPSSMVFSRRYEILEHVILSEYTTLKLLNHDTLPENFTENDILKLANDICDSGYEGIVCKLWNESYHRKRHSSWCKIKKFKTVDLEVISYETGTGKNENVLGALICKLSNGNMVKVGSGYSDEERNIFIKTPPKMIEVKYQEESKDSLRFPVFVRVREDK